jgi:hypothetical protein
MPVRSDRFFKALQVPRIMLSDESNRFTFVKIKMNWGGPICV